MLKFFLAFYVIMVCLCLVASFVYDSIPSKNAELKDKIEDLIEKLESFLLKSPLLLLGLFLLGMIFRSLMSPTTVVILLIILFLFF